jgi:hypothetical protein
MLSTEPERCATCGGFGRYVFSNEIDVFDGDGSWEHTTPTDHFFVPQRRGA